MKSGRDQMVIDPEPDQIYTKRKKEEYEYYELHSFVITQSEIPKRWLGKISRKDPFNYSHQLTGFPVQGENPRPGEKIQGTRVAQFFSQGQGFPPSTGKPVSRCE